ncbi:MAG: hypothetical protein H6Q18_760 [Bacteroidetes bacterium]|nr:hypothetical protein [Bacteroidota bacterium]
MLIGINFANSQTKPFKTISQFNGNVMNYLKYNVDERADYYKGKTVAELLKDLDIAPIGFHGWYVDSGTIGIQLYFKNYDEKNYSELADDYINIFFEKIIPRNEYHTIRKEYPTEKWVPQHYDFFKDMIIRRVEFNYFKEGYLKRRNLPNK